MPGHSMGGVPDLTSPAGPNPLLTTLPSLLYLCAFTSSEAIMSGRSILAALLGAVVFFVWGYLFYTVLPWSQTVMHPVPNVGAITPALADAPSGTYFYPDLIHTGKPLDQPSTMDAWNDLYRKGPLYEIRVHHGVSELTSPSLFIS